MTTPEIVSSATTRLKVYFEFQAERQKAEEGETAPDRHTTASRRASFLNRQTTPAAACPPALQDIGDGEGMNPRTHQRAIADPIRTRCSPAQQTDAARPPAPVPKLDPNGTETQYPTNAHSTPPPPGAFSMRANEPPAGSASSVALTAAAVGAGATARHTESPRASTPAPRFPMAPPHRETSTPPACEAPSIPRVGAGDDAAETLTPLPVHVKSRSRSGKNEREQRSLLRVRVPLSRSPFAPFLHPDTVPARKYFNLTPQSGASTHHGILTALPPHSLTSITPCQLPVNVHPLALIVIDIKLAATTSQIQVYRRIVYSRAIPLHPPPPPPRPFAIHINYPPPTFSPAVHDATTLCNVSEFLNPVQYRHVMCQDFVLLGLSMV
ncbi:hypothetical protein B0H16DRAFT_1898569 [Mycena metata]|uniref:Uncharacterized protein n=1 Tax=Mycena metata TaxID=1033252 RepID=A0AAD7HAD3_9AGAR|nr:hypothetical protein B0H16DRAFT_1898569 [Mycena metata]